jgi:hypothetical protein
MPLSTITGLTVIEDERALMRKMRLPFINSEWLSL